MPTPIPTEHLRENQTVFLRGKVLFSRIASQLERRRSGRTYITTLPYCMIGIIDPRVMHLDQETPTLEERYVESKIFVHKKGRNAGHEGYSIEDSSQALPLVFEPNPDNPGHVRQIQLQEELASDLDVTLVLRSFRKGTSKGIGLSQVVLHEPVRYYTETLKSLGIVVDRDTHPLTYPADAEPSHHVQLGQVSGQNPEQGAPDAHSDPVAEFPAFYRNPVIQVLADQPRWTVSDREKAPLNMRELARTGRLWGAHEVSEQCLVTLEELTRLLPEAANTAFHINAQSDGVVVLDVEKTCPPELAARLLALPALYSERSMSGLGHHLLLPLPQSFWAFPDAATKRVLKGPSGHFEVLQHHWVTFTRHVEPAQTTAATDEQLLEWDELWVQLARATKQTPVTEFDVNADEPDIPQKESVLAFMTAQPQTKSLDDFDHDASRFEFSVLSALYRHMRTALEAERTAHPSLTWNENQMAWVLYRAAQTVLPHRSKHEGLRNGLPYLLNQAQRYLALSLRRDAGTAGTTPRNR